MSGDGVPGRVAAIFPAEVCESAQTAPLKILTVEPTFRKSHGLLLGPMRSRVNTVLQQSVALHNPDAKVAHMTLRRLRVRSEGMACLIAIVGLLAGCARSSDPVTAPSGSGGAVGSGSGTHTTIQGVATPSSVSVVTAN